MAEVNWDDYIFINGVPIAQVDWEKIDAPAVELTVQWDGQDWTIVEDTDKVRLLALIKSGKDE